MCELFSEIRGFSEKVDRFTKDISGALLPFPLLKSVCESNEDIDITEFTDFMNKLKLEFQTRFTDFKKIENVVQLLNNSFSLKSNGV